MVRWFLRRSERRHFKRERPLRPENITFIVLTKNEEARLPRALASIPKGAHVLVLDAESTDATVASARARGAEVIVRPWRGFVAARRFALEQVRTPWTFMLDADEALDERLREALLGAHPASDIAGFFIKRTTFFCGRPIHGAGWGNEMLLRLFRTERASLQAQPASGGCAELHERWNVEGETLRLDGTLLHDSYPSIASYRRKFDQYTDIEAAASRGAFTDFLCAALVMPLRCAWLFFPRGGYRDGWRGVLVSLGSASYPLVVSWKAWRRPKP